MQIARLIGAPGTGKTTELLRLMEGALPSVGGDPNAIGLMSFTKAARQEAASRVSSAWNVPVDSLTRNGWIRTGHSICYKQLGVEAGQMVTDRKADLEWLAEAFSVPLRTSLDDETGSQVFIGDERVAWSLNAWNFHRVSLIPLKEVVERLARSTGECQDIAEVEIVADKYESIKRLDDRYDFTDLLLRFAGYSCSPRHGISRVTPEGELPPVKVWLFDEQQDASPLLDAVCKRLVSGENVKWCYAVGDPFQSIYGFAGSSAECFLGWDVAKERIMPKSYRCPAPILSMGERCLLKMNELGGYFDRNVQPADHEGHVSFDNGLNMIPMRPDEDWLFVARTNYQCSRIFAFLQEMGIPSKSARAQSEPTVKQIGKAALCKLEKNEPVTGAEWSRAVELLPSRSMKCEMLRKGTKKRWKDGDEIARWDIVFCDDLENLGCTNELVSEIRSGGWSNLVDGGKSFRRSVRMSGLERTLNPKVRVGTVHAVKGMEAENVAVLTTTSKRVAEAALDAEQHNEECRIAYVAATRAKRRLHIVTEGHYKTPRMEAFE